MRTLIGLGIALVGAVAVIAWAVAMILKTALLMIEGVS